MGQYEFALKNQNPRLKSRPPKKDFVFAIQNLGTNGVLHPELHGQSYSKDGLKARSQEINKWKKSKSV